MTWIAFDEKTQNALNAISGAPVKLAASSTDPLDWALASPRNSVLLAPIGTAGEMVVLTIRKNIRREPAPQPAAPANQEPTRSTHYVTSGFLGLSDEVELEDEPKQRKSWWKRLVG